MPSHLRQQLSFDSTAAQSSSSFYQTTAPPQKKQKMGVTQTYYLAHTARGKLSRQAARGDHDLRLLVGHANLLDSLMLELQDAERQQEAWFNQAVTKASEEPKHIQWADTVVEDTEDAVEDDASSESSDSDSDDEMEDDSELADFSNALAKIAARPSHVTVSSQELTEDEEDTSDDEGDESLALTRVPSRNPPELLHDSDDSSDDEAGPASPPQPCLEFSEKQQNEIAESGLYPTSAADQSGMPLGDHDFIDTTRHGATMIAAY